MAHSTVVIVENEDAFRAQLSRLLEADGLRVKGFASARDYLRSPSPESANCLVLGLRLPGLSGLELQQELLRRGQRIPIIFLTAHGDIRSCAQAMKAGALEFLDRPCSDQEFLDAVHRALLRDQQLRRQRAERRETRNRLDRLTPRERSVLDLITLGLPNKIVAAHLGITEKTVKIHRGRVMEKMAVDSIAQLVRLMVRLELEI